MGSGALGVTSGLGVLGVGFRAQVYLGSSFKDCLDLFVLQILGIQFAYRMFSVKPSTRKKRHITRSRQALQAKPKVLVLGFLDNPLHLITTPNVGLVYVFPIISVLLMTAKRYTLKP